MAEKMSKHAFGSKENIASAIASGAIDEYDILYLDNGEIGWVDKEKNAVINTPRTQKEHVLNGVSLGALSDGDPIPSEITWDDFLTLITEKPIPATYTKPTLSLANNGGQASSGVEAGTSITPKLKATFTQNDAGDLTAISIKQGSTAVAEGTTSPLTYSGEAIAIGDETITFSASASYEAAPIKNNNLGKESTENWFDAGNINSSNYSIVGQRNLFYGTGVGDLPSLTSDNVRALANKKLNPTQGYSWTINVAVGQQYIMFAYPSTLRDVNNVTYTEANDSGMASNFTKTLVSVADARGGENGLKEYKVYTYRMAVPAAAGMTFKITI